MSSLYKHQHFAQVKPLKGYATKVFWRDRCNVRLLPGQPVLK